MTIEPTAVKLVMGAAATGLASSAVFALSFTGAELTALTVAVGALIAAIFAGVVNVIVARANARATVKRLDEVSIKQDVIIGTTAAIDGHVNSAATALTADNNDLRRQIEKLTQALSESKTVARELAASTAVTVAAQTIQAASVVVPGGMGGQPAANQEQQVQRMQRVTNETHDLVTDLKGVDVPAVAEDVSTLVQSIKKETL